MGRIDNMKVITKDYAIRDDHYYIVSFRVNYLTEKAKKTLGIEENEKLYGTLAYDKVDSQGKTKAGICLADLQYGKTIPEAIEERNKYYEVTDFMKAHGLL